MKDNHSFLEVLSIYTANYFLINNLSPKTRKNYQYYINGVEAYLESINQKDILMSNVEPLLINNMAVFLLSKGDQTFASRTLDLCRRASDWALANKIIEVDKISRVKIKRAKIKDVINLDENELISFLAADINCKREKLAKDYYIIQSLQGLSYGDLRTFKIIKDSAGEWIYNQRCKGANEYWVPLNPIVKEILIGYNYKLPKLGLKYYNILIRNIAIGLNIDKHLTSHTGRKTFATRMYNEGWSIESIADMMGHSSTETTRKHYIKKSRKRLEMEVRQRQIA